MSSGIPTAHGQAEIIVMLLTEGECALVFPPVPLVPLYMLLGVRLTAVWRHMPFLANHVLRSASS
jgi:hypothetical protein